MRLIHVHGFKETEPESKITAEYKLKMQKYLPKLDVEEFKWETLEGNVVKVTHDYVKSSQRTEIVGSRLADYITSIHKVFNESVILSGFSLGASVVAHSLRSLGSYNGIQAVIFLGAAFPSDFVLPNPTNDEPCLLLNYYSDTWDRVLGDLYYNVAGDRAAGAVGLKNPGNFLNLLTGCTHTLRCLRDTSYCRLIRAICELIAWKIKGFVEGDINIPWQGPLALGRGYD